MNNRAVCIAPSLLRARTTLACSGLGDVPVKTQDFCENENEHHADKDSRLAHKGAHALLQLAFLFSIIS